VTLLTVEQHLQGAEYLLDFHPLTKDRQIVSLTTLTRFAVEILLIVPVFLLWPTVVSLVVRPFGVRLPLPLTLFGWEKHRSAFQALAFPYYVVIDGILYFGCGMIVAMTLCRYLDWKYWHGSSLTPVSLLRDALQYPLPAGIFYGVISYFGFGNRPK